MNTLKYLITLIIISACSSIKTTTSSSNTKNKTDVAYKLFYENYTNYHIPELDFRRIKRVDIEPFIAELSNNPLFDVSKLGESVQGRDINLIKLGNGPKTVLLWSQMHGDESTATRAIFEIFRFFATDDSLNHIKKEILDYVTMYFIPMLNPDGAEVFERRNALHVDLNRDALRLISPEARILKEVRDRYEPEFGFNLHDQSKHYNTYKTDKTAAISFLAPAYNYDKDVNDGRGNAMKLIVSMNKTIQEYMPGHVGRYDDAFEPRAFGDNIQKWGTNTILIESGGNIGDPEKKELVKINFMIMLHALHQIAREGYKTNELSEYYSIPENDRKFFDILIRQAIVSYGNQLYIQDIGLYNSELEKNPENIALIHAVGDLGDLSTFYGYEELDGSGLVVSAGKVVPDLVLDSASQITPTMAMEWIKNGYTTVKLKNIPASSYDKATLPIQVVSEQFESYSEINLGSRAPLILSKDGTPTHAVINGKLITIK